jgi:hypothetical protein
MYAVSANDLKKMGISAFSNHSETLITVRGEVRYITLDIESYEHLREAELEIAVARAKQDIDSGDYIVESAKKHIKRIKKMISK